MKYITIKSLKEKLKLKSRDDLIDEIIGLFKVHKEVKIHYSVNYDPHSLQVLFDKAKQKMHDEFFRFTSTSGPRGRIAETKKILSEFKKQSVNINYTIDLYLYYVKTLIDFFDEFAADDSYVYSALSVFENALEMIRSYQLEDAYNQYLDVFLNNLDIYAKYEFMDVYQQYSKE